MNLEEYSRRAIQTALNTNKKDLDYPMLGLHGEAGELCEKFKKVLRDKGGIIDDSTRELIKKEQGDILWYVNRILWGFDIPLDQVWCDCNNLGHLEEFTVYQLARFLARRTSDLDISVDAEEEQGIIYWAASIFSGSALLAKKMGYTLEDVLRTNVEKLEDRKSRGVLAGSGDNR